MSRPSAQPVDLLLVGGLTVDHFADGSTAPGGTVLHGARAARAAGFSVGIATVAGDEPAAHTGLLELGELATLQAEQAAHSVPFRHDEEGAVRTLTLLDTGVALHGPIGGFRPRAVLHAPIAGEVGSDVAGQAFDGAFVAATLQGWLRTLEPHRPVSATALEAMEPGLVAQLASADLLVASEVDLSAVASEPIAQLAALRAWFGVRPILAVTLGARGALVEPPHGRRLIVLPARVIENASTTGAGDAFAAVLTASLGAGAGLSPSVNAATAAAVAYIDRMHGFSAPG